MTVVVLLASHVFHLLAGTQRSEIACTEIEAGIVEDNYCSGMPKPDDKQKVCNEHLCPARLVHEFEPLSMQPHTISEIFPLSLIHLRQSIVNIEGSHKFKRLNIMIYLHFRSNPLINH